MLEDLDYSNQVKTRGSAKKLNYARIKLEETYIKEQERYAQGKVDEIRTAVEHQMRKLVWETVNEFTGRKGTKKDKIKANNLKDHMKKWKDYFKNLLRQPPVTTSKPTKAVFQHALSINTCTFPMQKLKESHQRLQKQQGIRTG